MLHSGGATYDGAKYKSVEGAEVEVQSYMRGKESLDVQSRALSTHKKDVPFLRLSMRVHVVGNQQNFRSFTAAMQLFTIVMAALASPLSILAAATGSYQLYPAPNTIDQSYLVSHWDVQPASSVSSDASALVNSNIDIMSWHRVNASRCTLVACLISAGFYREEELFWSDNLNHMDRSPFSVPWLYRHEFALSPQRGQHYFLETNGITSKAEVSVNGHQVANTTIQAGSYAGHIYEITDYVAKLNELLVQVYPTDYNYDFALGFVDWNPYPPDNGTGVWREVTIKQTGPVRLDGLRVMTDFDLPAGETPARVTIKATLHNLLHSDVVVDAQSVISKSGRDTPLVQASSVKLEAFESLDVSLTTTVDRPAIWWPKAWGDQPLYEARLSISVNQTVSDSAKRSFGIRRVTSNVNEHDDTIFSINGHPFQVLGAGYSADMFLRWDNDKFTTQAQYMLDIGLNTVRLEGKNEHPELYDIADHLGLMVLPGWECCDKWEAWSYNEDLAVKVEWSDSDYDIAKYSMRHEVSMLQSHPCVLGFLIGSDYWPDDRATTIYMQSFIDYDWQNPVIASASRRGFPAQLGPSGMKMDGPYDWVPPNYWYDIDATEDRLGAAFGFGSELGAGVGTPEVRSLNKFLSDSDLEDLWKEPRKGLFHMSTNVSSFYDRTIYNEALWQRLGAPTSLGDYIQKAQVLDYEATRAQFESYSMNWNAERPATGLIYWMLNNAWPSLHWNLFDYYLRPAGSYFGAKTGSRLEHIAYDYVNKSIHLINHSRKSSGARVVTIDAIDAKGKGLYHTTFKVQTEPNTSKNIHTPAVAKSSTDIFFLRLILSDIGGKVLSRNVYCLSKTVDTLDWSNSTWFYTPVSNYADYTALNDLPETEINVQASRIGNEAVKVTIQNQSGVPAFFLRLTLIGDNDLDALPVFWSDNYITLWPGENIELTCKSNKMRGKAVEVLGWNTASPIVRRIS